MRHIDLSDHLLRELVTGSHAEGTTCLAVAAAIEHQDRTLLLSTIGDDFETIWQLPTGQVLPSETLLQSLDRTVSLTTGLGIIRVTGYAGHHDRLIDTEVLRTFVFNVAVDDPECICRWANIGHRWTSEPPTAWINFDDSKAHPVSGTTTPPNHFGRATSQQLEAALRAGAKGLLCAEAAVELLVKQRSWLTCVGFVNAYVDCPDLTDQDPIAIASVDWAGALDALDAGRLPCSSGEGQLLRIAGSLAEGIPVDLRDAITSLDSTNTGLVARALCHAAGHRLWPPETTPPTGAS